ncbi:MAG: hypothetical protein ACE5MG_09095 [Candidatus Methylomirabilales bacterium]
MAPDERSLVTRSCRTKHAPLLTRLAGNWGRHAQVKRDELDVPQDHMEDAIMENRTENRLDKAFDKLDMAPNRGLNRVASVLEELELDIDSLYQDEGGEAGGA